MPFRLTIEEIKTIMKIEKAQTNDRDELQDAYINEIIDGMDMKDLMRIVYDNLEQNLEMYTIEELIEEVEEYYPHLLE